MTATNKEAKFRENGVMVKEWIGGRLRFSFRHAPSAFTWFDPRLVTQTNRKNAEEHGWEARLGDLAAIEIKDIPDRNDRSQAAQEKISAAISHYTSGSDEWNLPSGGRAATSRQDVIDAITRCYPERDAEVLFTRAMETYKLDDKACVKMWTEKSNIALAIIDIRAERARAAAGLREKSADDMIDELMGE
jgi:hypothetical protein